MAAPILPILVAVVALVGLAMSKKSGAEPPTLGGTAPAPNTVAPSPAQSAGVPSFPGAAAALAAAAAALGATPVQPPQLAPPSGPFGTPPPVTVPPIIIPVASGGGMPPVVAPPPAATSDGGSVVVVPPVSIVGQPTPASGAQPGQIAPWDSSSMVLPDPSSLPTLPAKYQSQSQESVDVQACLNSWGAAVGFQAVDAQGNNLMPLAQDGRLGHDSQLASAGFQVYTNATRNAGLTVDGIPGANTQTYLGDWGTISAGLYGA